MTDEKIKTYVTEDTMQTIALCKAYQSKHDASKLQWHDLRKDQKDLPDNSRYVWTNVGPGYHDDDGWWDDFGRLQDVVAWCEPKFEEETDEIN